MRDIFKYIEYSGVSKENLKDNLEATMERARFAKTTQGVYDDMSLEEIATMWFKNWLHSSQLRHMCGIPAEYLKHCGEEGKIEYANMMSEYRYELGQQNFSYTLEDIRDYIESKETWRIVENHRDTENRED